MPDPDRHCLRCLPFASDHPYAVCPHHPAAGRRETWPAAIGYLLLWVTLMVVPALVIGWWKGFW